MSVSENRSVQDKCSILAAAACIVQCAIDTGAPVTCIELQRLLVALQRLTLEETGQKCFCDEFEHWRTGPVFRSVWEAYREWGREPILHASEASRMRLVNMRIVRIPCTVSEACRERAGRVVEQWNKKNSSKTAAKQQVKRHKEEENAISTKYRRNDY